jgi:DNA/RNA-binding domain of Phe-tRNA-synthetase-like protein
MVFNHSPDIWMQCPELVPGVLFARGINTRASVSAQVARFTATARARLDDGNESALHEIQAWRRIFARMGLQPTKYRCASEALLRRLRKEDALPRLHPLVDLCNAISAAFAIPIAVFDLSKITGDMEVRHAAGTERYQTFAGETEHPEVQEVIYADQGGNAHARRWTNRQSSLSAVGAATRAVMIVAEAVHESAFEDMRILLAALMEEIAIAWPAAASKARVLTRAAPLSEYVPEK